MPPADAPSPEPLSILHVLAPAQFGGLESVVRTLAAGQTRRGHRVRVAAVLSGWDPATEHPLVAALRADGVGAEEVHVGARDYRGERAAVARLCRSIDARVLHTHGFRPDVVDGGVARALGIAAVSTAHGFIERSWRARVYQWMQRRALRRFDAVVAVSAVIRDRLRAAGVPADRIHLLANGFAPRTDALGRSEARTVLGLDGGRIVGWVGRLSHEKGADVALDAIAATSDPAVRLAVIGDGPDAATLRDRADRLGIGDRVSWLGALADAGRYFAAFDAFLLSSRTEGTPMVLLEAMSARIPIVATSVGGVPDVVDERSAYPVPSENPRAIAAALAALFADPDEAKRRAGEARSRVDRQFGVDQWLDRHDALYRSVVAHRRGRA